MLQCPANFLDTQCLVLGFLQQLASIGNNLTIQIVAGQSMKVRMPNNPSPTSSVNNALRMCNPMMHLRFFAYAELTAPYRSCLAMSVPLLAVCRPACSAGLLPY